MPTGNLPSEGKALFEKVYKQAKEGSCKGDEECAARTAWSAVKGAGWKKDAEGNWHKKAELAEFSLRITKASFDNDTGEMRWEATASDTDADSYNDNMSMELFDDFLDRINTNEPAPEEFRSDFWQGGMPYISVSHYYDLNGDAVPGMPDVVYVDGSMLKAKGKYYDTQLGRACWKAIRKDLLGKKSDSQEDKVRISIAFLDWKHQHKSNGFIFERKEIDDLCPECLMELIKSEYNGKIYLKGQLIHLALTRVPVNKRTLMEVDKSMTTRKDDAASIIGEELADEIEEKSKLVGKSEALVIKSDDQDTIEQTPEPVVEEAKTMKKDMEEQEEEDEKQDKGMMSKDEEDKVHEKEEKDKKKSEVSIEQLYAEIVELKSAIAPKEVPVPTHVLDAVIAKFKADYDAVLEMDVTADEKLQLVQQSYAEVGNKVVETIKSAITKVETKSETSDDRVIKMLETIVTRMDLLEAKMVQPAIAPQPAATVRRSAQPTPEQLTKLYAKPDVEQSATPNLRQLLSRTV